MTEKAYQIFVSHSQYDVDIRKSFSEIFAIAGIIPKYMEFEKIYPPAWSEIKKQIKKSQAVFLLLGPNIRKSYFTENWVAFEVGLACAFGKEVWVFEPMNLSIDFPIPYITDYMPYNLEIQEHFDYIRGSMEAYKSPVPIFPVGVEGRDKRYVPKGILVNCPHPNCQLKFHLHTDVPSLYCPSCRQFINRSENSSLTV
jgi:hypothetical protein